MADASLADAYATLGLAPGASEDEIRRAWRQKARATHPDLHPDDPDAPRRFRQAEAAHALLTDPVRRATATARSPRDGPDEDWIDGCTWMAEAYLIRLRRDALPRYAQRYRGGPSLAAALAAAAEESLCDRAPAVVASRWARAWAGYTWRRIDLVVDDLSPPYHGPVGLLRERDRIRILLRPQAFWARGVRDDDDLRLIVQRSIDLCIAATAPVLLGVALPSRLPPAEADRSWWAGQLFWPMVWVLVAALSVVLIGSGLYAANGPMHFR